MKRKNNVGRLTLFDTIAEVLKTEGYTDQRHKIEKPEINPYKNVQVIFEKVVKSNSVEEG